jgi:hypothetical protein
MATPSLLNYVIAELRNRRGSYVQLSREMAPENPNGYYSWLTKLATGKYSSNPGLHRIEALANRFRREEAARKKARAA